MRQKKRAGGQLVWVDGFHFFLLRGIDFYPRDIIPNPLGKDNAKGLFLAFQGAIKILTLLTHYRVNKEI